MGTFTIIVIAVIALALYWLLRDDEPDEAYRRDPKVISMEIAAEYAARWSPPKWKKPAKQIFAYALFMLVTVTMSVFACGVFNR